MAHDELHNPHVRATVVDVRILVVESYPDLGKVISDAVKILDHECRFAASVADALVIAGAFAPDIVLVGLGLIGVNGSEVVRDLRAKVARPLYIVAISGSRYLRNDLEAAGFDYTMEVVDVRELTKVIDLAKGA